MTEQVPTSPTVTPVTSLSVVQALATAVSVAEPPAVPALASDVVIAPPVVVKSLGQPGTAAVTRPVPTGPRAASVSGVDALTRARGTLAGIVPHVQYQMARVGAIGVAGVAALIVAAVVAVSALIPGQNAVQSLTADLARAQQHPHAASTTDEGLGRLVAALPTRDQMPVVIGQVLQEAQQAGVPLDSGHYAFTPAKSGNVGRYEVEFPVKASYPKIRDFINRTLTAVPAAGLDKLHIERKTVGDEVVNADVRFVIFVRGE